MPYWRWKSQYWRPSFRVPGLQEALRELNADVFHIGPLPYNSLMYAGLHAGEVRGVPVVATPCSHLGEPGSNAVAQYYLQPHQVRLLRHCRKVFCMTQTERSHLEKLGLASSRLSVRPFAVDLQLSTGGSADYLRKRYKVDGPVVLHLGMKAYEKGSETLLEAMKLLWAKGSKAWLVMAGPSLSTFDEYVSRFAQGCVRLLNLPAFEDAEKRDFLASATVVAQPSRVESLGLVLLEAWANNKPVIAADIDVSRELVEGSGGGTITPFGNAAKLAEAIEAMLSNPELRDAMGAGGHRKAIEYQGDRLWQQTTEELEQVAADTRVRASR
jgi:glycosyltransferase involved in cell wall biosynthesis